MQLTDTRDSFEEGAHHAPCFLGFSREVEGACDGVQQRVAVLDDARAAMAALGEVGFTGSDSLSAVCGVVSRHSRR